MREILLQNIFSEGELNKDSVTEKISATATAGTQLFPKWK